ncbi:class 1b ribonucleoside-diphosphate reductase subunit alpha [Paenibacillus alvei]|uniref:class 1b ribonucleoside-diphosphate reductase subunit alpha n=1 Tax=Paenibacillus alvei TaxID=44250 RepID=UPI000288D14B|nr:class 1b ribonucleoside-diphosphate reductase subunit alpha [Paenibacillus alvei]EJW13902.1 ribonucleoside-diphosphate reductase subunit alpha [Paenibacillus alvei DSM 29]MCY9544837.1 class 1b ribonucleoside-diphosphate reductase subunit alpha [Paenibacillus alvei]MCY9707733.1 class 1b ribonucleoside-diphosphate reductase subunit alpha [Paenibacillus alvei]MCY9757714.1 class 1b ribonucleoside-diphosphate reductase subunit alpha [Paenibacillus alvei]MEC0082754.1 class 1b ribonucleoside-dipho
MKYIELNNKMANQFKENFDFEALLLDKIAVEEFLKEVESKSVKFASLKERMEFLIHNSYYIDFYEMYSYEQIEEIHDFCYSFNFEFQSFMAVSKFYQDYALKSDNGLNWLESYEDRVAIVALFLGNGDFKKAKRICHDMMLQNLQPATPTFKNAGLVRAGELVSCFLLSLDDSLNSIAYNANSSMQLSKIGGGVATNFTRLRGRNEEIKGIDNCASGIVPVLKIWEDIFSYVDQLGQRKGAGAGYYHIMGWDIEEFLSTKKINADEKARLQSLSIGVIVPDVFMKKAWKGEDYYVFAPYTVYKTFGIHLDDMDMNKWYDKLVASNTVKKRKINARKMLDLIAELQMESGYPYIMYVDNANKVHALRHIGSIKQSNLCTEIMQLQEVSYIDDPNDSNRLNEYKRDISCNLSSGNIVNMMKTNRIKETSYSAMDGLTTVAKLTNISQVPSVALANDTMNSVGFGAMNLHGFFAKNQIDYESDEAKDFVNVFFMMVNYYTIERSMQIALEEGKTFQDFEKSDYADGSYFKRYIEKDYLPKFEKIAKLFEGMHIPTREDWKGLMNAVMKNGMYHSYRLAIAPTQSISYVQNATPSISPIVNVIESRMYGKSNTYYPMPFLSMDTYFYYKSAYETDMYKMIDLIAVMQEHVDQGISTILYVTSNTPSNELASMYAYAWAKGLKSLYYTRTKTLKIDECESCAV